MARESGLMRKLGIDLLDLEQRRALAEEIWNSIDAEEFEALRMYYAERAEIEFCLVYGPDDLEDLLASLRTQ